MQMTYEPVSMTMPSVDCSTSFPQTPKAFVLDRLKQRVTKYERHGQDCAERYNHAQQTIRANEKQETARLWQKVQDNSKNKKGAKCRMDSRPKMPTVEPSDGDNGFQGLSLARVGPTLKRKMPMGGESRDSHGYGDNGGPQQEPKKMKNDQQNMNNNQRQDYSMPSVSVQIVQNFAGEPANQIETTVNVHSNRNMSDSQSVRVNVDSKNIKQETDGRRGQQPQMNQQNMNPCGGTNDAADLGGLLGEDFMPTSDDIDLNMLDDIIEQMPEVIEGFAGRGLMTPDTQQHPTPPTQMPSQSPQMPPQSQQQQQHHHAMMSQSHHPMTSQSPQMISPSQNHHVTSQSPQMTPQSHHPMTSQSHHPMTSQSHHPMTSQSHHPMTPQSHHPMTPQSHHSMTSQPHHPIARQSSPRLTPHSHQPHMSSQPSRVGAQQMQQQMQRHLHHNMTSQSPQMASQYQHQQQQQQHHMTSHPQRMTSPLRHMPSPTVQHMPSAPVMQQNGGMVCKREKVDMYHAFRGNTPENKPEPQGLPRQNSHGMTQQNISANIVNRQSVQITGGGNFTANLSSQQNISLNMMQQNSYNPSQRMMPSNANSNMTSQHIHRLNQVAQFGPREPTPPEQSRMFHASANTHGHNQANFYESQLPSSQQLKQLAEKRSYGINPSSASMNMATHDPRASQHFPPHYRGDGAPPAMNPQMNVHSHHHPHAHHHANMAPSSAQRMTPMDGNVYARSSSQIVQAQRPGINVMMQQSEAMVMKQYPVQPSQHPSYYNRVPEPHSQQVVPVNPNQGYPPGSGPHPSWNSRGGQWQSHNPMHRTHMAPDQRTHMPQDHRPQMTPDHMRPQMNADHLRSQIHSDLNSTNFLPELDNDLNIIDEILSKTNA